MADLEVGRDVLVTLGRSSFATGTVVRQDGPGRYLVRYHVLGVPREIAVTSDGAGGWQDGTGRKVEISARQ